MTINRVIIQVRQPSGSDQVSEGYYVVDAGVLTMTFADGSPVDPDQFRHTLKDGDSPAAIAGILTREVRRTMLGISKDSEAFNRPLDYAASGVA